MRAGKQERRPVHVHDVFHPCSRRRSVLPDGATLELRRTSHAGLVFTQHVFFIRRLDKCYGAVGGDVAISHSFLPLFMFTPAVRSCKEDLKARGPNEGARE